MVLSEEHKLECEIYQFGEPMAVSSQTANIFLDLENNRAQFISSVSATEKVTGSIVDSDKNILVVDLTESNISAYFYHFKHEDCIDNVIDILDNFDRRPAQRARAMEFMHEVYFSNGIKIDSILQIRLEAFNRRIWRHEIQDVFYVLNCTP